MLDVRIRGLAVILLSAAAGCIREESPNYALSKKVVQLKPEFQHAVEKILVEECGTPAAPRLLGDKKIDLNLLKKGAVVYGRHCQQCHGVTGDGDGPAAAHMLPRPRDYRPGIFKFTSTTYGSKPLREDLIRTIRRGIRGTSMPSFALMPEQDVEMVVDYVLSLTHRGELEIQLAESAELDGEVDPKNVPETVETILKKWTSSKGQVVYPVTPMPELAASHAEAGRSAFLVKGCSQCHGEDGRGQTKENIGVDAWGRATKAADLTSGMFRGGTEPLDIYRHIYAGINGTPMPSFANSLQKEPETIWNLVAYVLYLSDTRRRGVTPEAGILKPLPGVETAGEQAALRTVSSSIK